MSGQLLSLKCLIVPLRYSGIVPNEGLYHGLPLAWRVGLWTSGFQRFFPPAGRCSFKEGSRRFCSHSTTSTCTSYARSLQITLRLKHATRDALLGHHTGEQKTHPTWKHGPRDPPAIDG